MCSQRSRNFNAKRKRVLPKSHSWPATSAAQQAQASLPPEAVQSAGSKRQSWDPQCPQDAAVAVVVKEPLTVVTASTVIHLFNTKH